jgi:hypothetical protein
VQSTLPRIDYALGRIFSFGLRTNVCHVHRREEGRGGSDRQDSHEQ